MQGIGYMCAHLSYIEAVIKSTIRTRVNDSTPYVTPLREDCSFAIVCNLGCVSMPLTPQYFEMNGFIFIACG